jgi:membrane-associated protein
METLIKIITDHASNAHIIAFCALILAGFNIPISEDLIIIVGGIIASTIIPENTYKIFIALFLGSYISGSISYWLGRILGNKLRKFKWLKKLISKEKFINAQNYYQRHGFKTLLFGRFIPFGVRNCLFLTAGIGKMDYRKFLISDGIACFTSNICLFTLTYHLGKNYEVIFKWVKTFNIVVFIVFISTLIFVIILYKRRKKLKLLQK